MNEAAELKRTREGDTSASLAVLVASVLLLMPLVGQIFSCLFWAYVTRTDFNPLYQD